MKTKHYLLSIIFLIGFVSICFSQQSVGSIDLTVGWRFLPGDQPNSIYPDFDDSSWKEIKLGSFWETQGYSNLNGVAFYRLKVLIPSSLRQNIKFIKGLKLSLGKIDDGDVTFFNGKVIGKANQWDIPREYIIPFSLINWDQGNVIVVKVQDNGGNGGMFEGPYTIGQLKDISKIISINVDNKLDKSSPDLELTKSVSFAFGGAFDALPCQFQVQVFETNTKENIFDKTYDMTIGAKADSSLTYSFRLAENGWYRVKYTLSSLHFSGLITSNTLLTYKEEDHSNPFSVKPKVTFKIPAKAIPLDLEQIHLDGYLGERVQANIDERLLKIDEKGILECFYNRPGVQTWVGEYAGKYLHAAARAWNYSKNAQLKAQMDRIVDVLVHSQLEDGYLGTYIPANYWTAWDVWAHKYDLLGLLSYYSVTGYQPALETSIKIGDLMCKTFGTNPGQIDIITTGEHVGMASCSILEPMTDLYRNTDNQKYLDFCNYIVNAYDHAGGPKIISTLNTIGKVNKTANGKAYEMMSNFTGIVKLYQLTGNKKLISAMEAAWKDISINKLYITGTASRGEHFPEDFDLPAGNDVHMGEGCVTTTWIQFNQAMYNLTGEVKYIDEIEKSIYNQLLAAENPTTGCVSYYTALQGVKPYRCTIYGHCCLASVPRAIAAIPELVYTKNSMNGLNINIYSSGTINDRITTPEGKEIPVKISVNSQFPEKGIAELSVSPEKQVRFKLSLRVPIWCRNYVATLDGKTFKGIPGQYLEIDQLWTNTSKIGISFDLNVQELDGGKSYPGFVAIKSGAQVLAFDQALNPEIKNPDKILVENSSIQLLSSKELPKSWFGKQLYSLKAFYESSPVNLKLVPFAEAGQTGGEVRVWMKKK